VDNGNVAPEVFTRQAEHSPQHSGEIQPRRKVGMVIVRSDDLTKRFFRGPKPGRNFPVWDENEDWSRRVAEAGAL
jgi:hypothetical protein